jgi:uncharacterized protein DUF3168
VTVAELVLPVDIEALVSAFLRDQDEIAALVEDRVYTALPKAPRFPAVRVTQIIDRPIEPRGVLWGLAFSVQVEAFGGGKAAAWRIAATARAAIDQRLKGVHDGYGVVTGSDPGTMMDLPDTMFDPAVPRWLFTSTVWAHPVATLAS